MNALPSPHARCKKLACQLSFEIPTPVWCKATATEAEPLCYRVGSMASGRKRDGQGGKRVGRATAKRTATPSSSRSLAIPPTSAGPSPLRSAEAGLLALAREVARVETSADGRSPIRIALDVVAAAHAGDGALSRALYESRSGADSSEAARLALAWAR